MLKKLATALSLLGFIAISPANADLHGRLAATPGGTDYRAYYDDVTNLTWLKDSNIPWTLERRHLYWDEAVIFGNVLTVAGLTGWRLPSIDRNGDGVIVQCGPRFPDVTLEECKDNEFEALMVSNGFWASGVNDSNGNGRIDEGEVVGEMGPFENFHARLDFWSSNRGKTDAFGNEYAFFYMPPYVDPEVHPTFYLSTHGERLNSSINMQSWYVRSGDVLVEICDNGIDDNGDGLIDGEDPDCQEVCDNGIDDDADGHVDDEDSNCFQPLVRCNHTPIYAADSGEIFTVHARAISENGTSLVVDEIEVWLGFDKENPQGTAANTSEASLEFPPGGDSFSYACLARNGDKSHFSGWRTVALGEFPYTAIPIVLNNGINDAIDIVFFADEDEYASFTDPAFLEDVGLLITEGYGTVPWFVEFQDYFNFWIGRTSGNSGPDPNDSDPSDGILCLREAPANFFLLYPFADSAGIVHRSQCRDNAGSPGLFTIEMDLPRLQVVAHETGHRPFGLMDEYCCDGGYASNTPFPNLLHTETDCLIQALARGFDPADCRSFIKADTDEDWWIFEPIYRDFTPEPHDLMQQTGCWTFYGFDECSTQLTPDLIAADPNPNGLYACDAPMTTYVGDTDGTLDSSDVYWLCRIPGSAPAAVWQRFRGNLDRYFVGPSELDRLMWFLSHCDGGDC